MAPRLSHKRSGGRVRERIHIVSDAAVASAQYSASMEDHAMERCFFELHDIGFDSRKMRYTDVEMLSSKLPPNRHQSKSIEFGLHSCKA